MKRQKQNLWLLAFLLVLWGLTPVLAQVKTERMLMLSLASKVEARMLLSNMFNKRDTMPGANTNFGGCHSAEGTSVRVNGGLIGCATGLGATPQVVIRKNSDGYGVSVINSDGKVISWRLYSDFPNIEFERERNGPWESYPIPKEVVEAAFADDPNYYCGGYDSGGPTGGVGFLCQSCGSKPKPKRELKPDNGEKKVLENASAISKVATFVSGTAAFFGKLNWQAFFASFGVSAALDALTGKQEEELDESAKESACPGFVNQRQTTNHTGIGFPRPAQVQVYPNPMAAPQANIQVYLPQSDEITIEVFDNNGKLLQTLLLGKLLPAGTNTLPVNTRTWLSGQYLIKVSGNQGLRVSKRLIKK
ncbi:T9SS type A sorting domain-containing protein [Microscilla marina]|uniref:Secretion system C-terminal sorting domain-containing protein n=1 Tax=Microscilla marina ATCC 23134 TaxID=313606 RepID=A1ZQM3_MICM2|nr:T9SS type A sorting domain-containing protein [Microscilla marina]EAY27395.1 hypothetical protein M23134_08347 [Microscilla marina ATCC 23134]